MLNLRHLPCDNRAAKQNQSSIGLWRRRQSSLEMLLYELYPLSLSLLYDPRTADPNAAAAINSLTAFLPTNQVRGNPTPLNSYPWACSQASEGRTRTEFGRAPDRLYSPSRKCNISGEIRRTHLGCQECRREPPPWPQLYPLSRSLNGIRPYLARLPDLRFKVAKLAISEHLFRKRYMQWRCKNIY